MGSSYRDERKRIALKAHLSVISEQKRKTEGFKIFQQGSKCGTAERPAPSIHHSSVALKELSGARKAQQGRELAVLPGDPSLVPISQMVPHDYF